MRCHIFGLLIFISACMPVSIDQAAAVGEMQNTAVLSADPVSGEWVFHGTMDYNAACYGLLGAPESECIISIQCNIDTGDLSLILPHERGERRETTLNVLTSTASVALAALVDGESGTRADVSDIAEIGTLKQALMPKQERFAIQIADVSTVFPWNDEVYELLLACEQ